MTRFEQKASPVVYAAIAVVMGGVLLADILTPLGVAVWVFYIAAIGLTLFTWRPVLPMIVAGGATALMVICFFTDREGAVVLWVARANRVMGITTLWMMAGACGQTIRNKLAVKKQDWLQTGQMRLSEMMRGEHKVAELGERVLQFLAEYLGAQVAVLYVEESEAYHRTAGYALPSAHETPARVAPGEGLVGQAAKDGRAFVVRDVPEGYVSFGSAMGSGKPRAIIVAPVKADGAVNAVIELGFAGRVFDSDLELLDRVAESVGVAIRSAKYRTRLQELLEETQRQAEELQAQGEELRVSNEELEEQGRALKESQARLELQQAELEQTNTQLEEQTQLLEAQKDEVSRAKAAVEHQARELEQASRYKSDFLANMSHELRTPLNSSLILAKLLADNREGNLTDEQVRYAQTIHGAGNDLLLLISDILDLSKIEAGRMEMRPERVRVADVLETLRRTFEPMAAAKGLAFRAAAVEGAPEQITTDPQRLEQVLRNLLSNAIKFTAKGEVTLEVKPADGRVAFAVHDTGIGIAPQQRDVIFEAFRQADGTTSRKYGGTGLGLSISREFARLLGGAITLDSQEGHGSTFTLTLPETYEPAVVQPRQAPVAEALKAVTPLPQPVPPVVQSPKPSKPAVPQGPRPQDDREKLTGSGRVILVVEDDRPFARILYDLAHEMGFQCLIAHDGEEGLSLAVQYLPSAVVLDVGLPDHSGLSVLDRLKRDARTRHIPVHVVSASDHAETALALGAVGYMLKPVKREELAGAFERLETKLTRKMRRVLLVEDDPVQLESLQRLLGTRDVETVGVRSAAECLERLKSETFDCMVLDLSLPDASGFALLETLSHEDRYSFPPVIVYTGRDLTLDEEQQLRKHSKSIIIKGAKSPERLLDEVTLFLHQVVSELPEEHQAMLVKARSRDAALEGRRVLVVEDDVRNVFALTSVLEPHGVNVVIARNGREALEALDRSAGGDGAVDLVLMDIMMPEMDGLTATREIRKRPEWRKLPIIALTAKAMRHDQEQCLAAGANDYMPKPLDVDKLLSLVRVWMPR